MVFIYFTTFAAVYRAMQSDSVICFAYFICFVVHEQDLITADSAAYQNNK